MPRVASSTGIAWAVLCLTFVTLSNALADPSWGDAFSLEQPDGTAVEVRIWGDEYYRVVESPDGYTLVRDPDTGIICYATVSPAGDELMSTGIRFDALDGDALGLDKHLRIDSEVSRAIIKNRRAEAAEHDRQVRASLGMEKAATAATTTGNVEGITLIIDFSDEPGTIPPAEIDNYLNQPGYNGNGNNGSVRDYFYDVSDSLLTYTNYVPTFYYRAINPKTYYDDCSNGRARELIREALNHLNSQGFDFSQYDSNGDGYIDALNCFYAGVTRCAWSLGLWPHSSSLSWSADGVSTYRYQITGLGTNLTLGTFCHENGHMLCRWPDLYDYDGDSRGVGRYCIMCNRTSNTNPEEPSAPMKYYAGWGNVVELLSYTPNLIAPSQENTYFKYSRPGVPWEYYLIENRQKSGRDILLPDSGLAIWHVDEYGDNDNQQMTSSLHYEVTLVQADGNWDLENDTNSGDGTDLFAAPDFTVCGPDTDPNTNWWNGSPSLLKIEEIGFSGTDMTFTFNPAGQSFVPGQFPTIQAAIDAAPDGETIVLAAGTYTGPGNVDVDFLGKIVTLKAAEDDPALTVIDCSGAPGDPHRAFNFTGGEGPLTRVEGITIINGYADVDGGAVLCDGASPTLRNIHFVGNEAANAGGALSFGNGSSPLVEGCVFVENTASSGGAVALNGVDAALNSCTFTGNAATNGAAVACLGTATAEVTNSLLVGSLVGAAAYCDTPGYTITLDCCNVYGNAGGDWVDCLLGQDAEPGNLSVSPLFCDAAAGDFSLREDSPCAGPTVCGASFMGALDVGCFADLFSAVTTGALADSSDGRGAAWGDYDGDGDSDLFLVNYEQPDVLLRNDAGGVFTPVADPVLNDAGPGTAAAWGDYDNDGDLDLYVARWGAANSLYRNDGVAGFADVTAPPLDDAGQSHGVNWVDYDSDGKLDLYIVNDGTDNQVIKNFGDLGGGTVFFFATPIEVLNNGGSGVGASWVDFDNDGDQDAYLVNNGRNVLVENTTALGFIENTGLPANLGIGSGADWGDFDNDGRLDLYLVNRGQTDVLWHNDGAAFSSVYGDALGDAGDGTGMSWADYDNDGDLDFILARTDGTAHLVQNFGGGNFRALGVPVGAGICRSVTWCDYDQDGDLDAYVTKSGPNILLQNDLQNGNHWFQVRLTGDPSNRAAIGARVSAVSGGLEQIREITAGGGHLSMNPLTADFGVGTATLVDSLIISWPSGAVETVTGLAVDSRHLITEGVSASRVPDGGVMTGRFVLHGNVPNPFNPSTLIRYELGRPATVDLRIFDLGGRLVRQLRAGRYEAPGIHEVVWNGRDAFGHTVASGTYFYRLEAGEFSQTKRMLLVK